MLDSPKWPNGTEEHAATVQVLLSTRDRLVEERRFKHQLIVSTVQAIGMLSMALFGTFFADLAWYAALSIGLVGIAITAVSMFAVRAHRKALLLIEWKGYRVEKMINERGVPMPEQLFERPAYSELSGITIPAMAHIVLMGIWVIVTFSTLIS